MFSALFGGERSGRDKTVPRRSERPSRRSQRDADTHRSENGAHRLDDGARGEVLNADELRRRRVDHYTSPVDRRRTRVTESARTKTSSSLGARSVTSSEKRHTTRRRHSSTAKTSPRSQRPDRSVDDGDRVYAPRSTALEAIDEERRVEDGVRGPELRRATHGRFSRSTRIDDLPDDDDDVHPDDSISQIGTKSSRRRGGAYTQTRPSLRRSNTTSTRLSRLPEESSGRSARSSSKRTDRPTGAPPPPTSRRHSSTAIPDARPPVECLTCCEELSHKDVAHLPCTHKICHDCVRGMFERSLKNPADMPPKCCDGQCLPQEYLDTLFDEDFKAKWIRKYRESNTKDALYCPAAGCGYWIKPKHIHNERGKKFATCPKCKTKVCARCSSKMHKSSECPKDPGLAKLMKEAEQNGWMQCFKCKAMVERVSGCSHMTCRCTAEFCITCGAKWKTCECSWWNYDEDPLGDMQIPEPVRFMFDQGLNAAINALPRAAPAQNPAPGRRPQNAANGRIRGGGMRAAMTYQEEMDARRRQERLDADLARRMQMADLGVNNDGRPRRQPGDDNFGFGNAARHLLNDDFVQIAANVVMGTFGDAALGRRGERASGRRRRTRVDDQAGGDDGLPANFLGDASVLGAGPARGATW